MPNHEMSAFLYNLKAQRYNVNLMNKLQSESKHFRSFICDYLKKLKMKKKLP